MRLFIGLALIVAGVATLLATDSLFTGTVLLVAGVLVLAGRPKPGRPGGGNGSGGDGGRDEAGGDGNGGGDEALRSRPAGAGPPFYSLPAPSSPA